MKVRVVVTVDIDPEAWTLNYGIPAKEIRADVQNYCQQTVIEQLNDVGVLTEGF